MSEKSKFDLKALRLTQDFNSMVGVKKVITTIPVRKSHKQEFFRVHPEEEYHFSTAVIEVKEDRETFLVAPDLWSNLPNDIVPKMLMTAMTRQGVLFLLPLRLPNTDGRQENSWNRSAREAAELAKNDWIKMVSNMSLSAYEVFKATGELPEPEWPDLSFDKILEIAFRGKFIDSMDHPVINKILGAI